MMLDMDYKYYGQKLSCPFLTPAEESGLQNKCTVRQNFNRNLNNLAFKADAVIVVRDWRNYSCSFELSKDLENVNFIQASPAIAKCADFSQSNPILGSYWGGSD